MIKVKSGEKIAMKRMDKSVVSKSFKIITAAICAISLAEMLNLNFSISAGIIAILTIQPTKRETIFTALSRFYALLGALIISGLCFCVIGINVLAYFVFLIIYIVLCQICGWYSAMTSNAVLISHFVTTGVMDFAAIRNEVLLFSIGVSIGIVANLHLHKQADYMKQLQKEADEQIIMILAHISERIIENDMSDYNGECFVTLKKQIRKAKNTADKNYNNQFKKDDTFDIEYIAMRDKQCQVLYEMYKNVRNLNSSPITAKKLSGFLKNMSEVFKKENNGKVLMEQFYEMDLYMKSQPLPITRKEFEDRARLFGLMRNIEEFILIKIEFANRFQDES